MHAEFTVTIFLVSPLYDIRVKRYLVLNLISQRRKKAELPTSSSARFFAYSVIDVMPSIAISNAGAEPYSDSWKYPSEIYSVPSFS